MRKSRFTDELILAMLKEAEQGNGSRPKQRGEQRTKPTTH